LIVGAGPTGLVLALWLTRLGVRVRIIDKTAEPATTSRAVAVQARTLESYGQIGLAGTLVARGRRAEAVNLWSAGRHVARATLGAIGSGISPYPYALIYPQDEHERLLIAHLDDLGVKIERTTELVGVDDDGHRVCGRIRESGGAVHTCTAAYLAGCDGAHSTVREALGIGFGGGTYEHLFYVADVDASGSAMNGEIHVALDRADFLAVFPLREQGRARLVGTVRDDAMHQRDPLSWGDVSTRVIQWLKIDVTRVNWFSTYHVHHRVADCFQRGRVFLVGDAAHIHSPVGGQGMNTGIGDAINLAWKIAAVLDDAADAAILDTYDVERYTFARRLVDTTDQIFTGVTSSGTVARALRLHVIPLIMPGLFRLRAVRRFAFRTVSQTAINYRGSALSEGKVGAIHGGDRLPWVKTGPSEDLDADNFAPLRSLTWQVHVYGAAAPELRRICDQRGMPLHVFAWAPAVRRSGLRQGAAYLVRPDGYVALAVDRTLAPTALVQYLDSRLRGNTASAAPH
jgi:2-polyprenyl-6-methoxyphenol hydroxylase-like FAD-dependent oxidoreductase